MSIGTMIILLALILGTHDIISKGLKLLEWKIKSPQRRIDKWSDLYD